MPKPATPDIQRVARQWLTDVARFAINGNRRHAVLQDDELVPLRNANQLLSELAGNSIEPVSDRTWRYWIRHGAACQGRTIRLASTRIGSRVYISRAMLRAFMQACSAPPPVITSVASEGTSTAGV
jgi:hypothetical protein